MFNEKDQYLMKTEEFITQLESCAEVIMETTKILMRKVEVLKKSENIKSIEYIEMD